MLFMAAAVVLQLHFTSIPLQELPKNVAPIDLSQHTENQVFIGPTWVQHWHVTGIKQGHTMICRAEVG